MTDTSFIWTPPAPYSLPIRGRRERLPVKRIFCVGRNYHAHAQEMGRPVDKSSTSPFYFTKSPTTLVESGATIPYPPETANYHFEMELVVVIGKCGFRVTQRDVDEIVYGYCCGLDMTRRDLQLAARDIGRPWDLGKDFENSAVASEVVPMSGTVIERGEITLSVNGETRQQSNVDKLIWNIRELVVDLSLFYHLEPGDLIYTGTPEGVGPVHPGDRIDGTVEGVGEIALSIGPAK